MIVAEYKMNVYFSKLLQTLDPLTTHRCEEGIFQAIILMTAVSSC